MAFTKIVGAGIHTLSNVNTHNINSSGIITATQFVGIFTGTDGDFSGNVTIDGNLTVNGTTTTLDTTLQEVDQLFVSANNGTVGAAITQSGSGDILRLYDGSTQVLKITDDGSIQVDTTVDQALTLNATDSGPVYTGLQRGGSRIAYYGYGGTGTNFKIANEIQDGDFQIQVNDGGNEFNAISIDASERKIQLSQKVGVNRSPGFELDVESSNLDADVSFRIYNSQTGSSNDTIIRSLVADNTASNYIFFGDPEDTNIGQIRYSHNNNSLQITVNAQERIRINSSGNVGINSTIPANKLDVANGAAWIYPNENGDEAIALKLGKLENYVDSLNDILVSDDADSVTNRINRYVGNWYFDRTTSPGATRINAFQLKSHDSGSYVGNSFVIRDLKNTADSIKLWSNGDSFIGVTTDGTTRNFGVGTASPTNPLHIKSADPQIKIEDSANNTHAQIFLDGPNSNLNFDWVSGSQRNINLINSGNGAIRVGIGSTTPVQSLHVVGNVQIDGDSASTASLDVDNQVNLSNTAGSEQLLLNLRGNVTNNGQLIFKNIRLSNGSNWETSAFRVQRKVDNTNMAYIDFGTGAGASGRDIQFAAGNGTLMMHLDNTGNVGINTTRPNTELEVYDEEFANITIHSERTSGNIGGIDFRKGGGSTGIQTAQYFVNTNGEHFFHSQGSEALKIASHGAFTFYNSAAEWNTLQRANTGHYIGLRIIDADSTQRMQFGVAGTTNHIVTGSTQHDVVLKSYKNLLFATNQTERLQIQDDGDIYTSGDQVRDNARLTITKNAVGISTILFLGNIHGSSTGSKISANKNLILCADAENNSNSSHSNIIFETGASEKVRISDSGFVGIGTNNPSHELDIESTSPVIEMKDNDAGDSRFQIAQSGAQTYFDMDVGNLGSSSLRLRFAGQEKVRFTTSGKVGIGTIAPARPLHIEDSDCRIRLTESGEDTDVELINNGGDAVLTTNGASNLRLQTNNLERLRIKSDGDVGIGTDNPAVRFHVHGKNETIARFGNVATNEFECISIANNVHGYPAIVQESSGDTLDLRSLGAVQVTLDSNNNDNNTKYFRVSANGIGNTATELFRVHEDGDVGIGTASPEEKLDIRGHVKVDSGPVLESSVSGGVLKITSATGYTEFGSKNTSYAHFGTDRSRYYFDKRIIVNEGIVGSYDEDLVFMTDIDEERIRIKNGASGIIQLNIARNSHIRGGVYAKYTGASGDTANINTSSAGKVSWLQTNTTIFENGGFTNTATDVTVPYNGIYQVIFNGYLESLNDRTNVRFRYRINGTDSNEDLSLNNYIRHDSGHNESSVNFIAYLNLSSGDTVAVSAQAVGASGTVTMLKDHSSLTFHLVA